MAKFQKGQSGNPKGKPPGTPNKANADVKAYAGQYTTEAVDGIVAIARDPEAPPAARVSAWREILDRGHGKPPQAITGADGGELALALTKRVIFELHPGGTPERPKP